MNTLLQSILWRRLDAPGYDACALWSLDNGWRLSGTAVFAVDAQPCQLVYEVTCDASWRTNSASVSGWLARTVISLSIEALPDQRWRFNGSLQPGVEGLLDVDLGFTPATNLIQLRRLDLKVGEAVDAPAVYLHFPELTLGTLEHRYHRQTRDTYDYRAPRFDYAATLVVSEVGFVTQYPGLWEVEAMR